MKGVIAFCLIRCIRRVFDAVPIGRHFLGHAFEIGSRLN